MRKRLDGDTTPAARIGGNAVAGFAATGIPRVLTWCPTCNIQLSEIVMPSTDPGFSLEHVVPTSPIGCTDSGRISSIQWRSASRSTSILVWPA
jgi:hypothetical protein